MDFDDVLVLVSIEEKLRNHTRFKQIYDAVVAELDKVVDAHAKPKAPDPLRRPLPAPSVPAKGDA